MFGKDEISSKGESSILAKDLFIKGNIISESSLEIQGRVEGDINGNIVTLRENGFISGNIYSKVLNLKGKFNGIAKSEKINISKKAEVKGTLEYEILGVEDGASIYGELKRVNVDKKQEETQQNQKEKNSNKTEK